MRRPSLFGGNRYRPRMAGPNPSAHAAPAIAFFVCAAGIAVFSAMDAVMKGLVIAIGVYNAMLWRTLCGLLLSGGLAAIRPFARPTRATLRVHIARGLVSVVMALLFFWGLARVPMAQAIALSFIAPLLSLLLAAVILKERVERHTVIASLIGLAGVGVILAGQASADYGPEAMAGAIAILLSALCYAFNIILMRQQALVADPIEVSLFQNITVGTCLLIAAPFLARAPVQGEMLTILLAALFATVSQLLMAWAYARAPANYLAPTEYTAFVWAALFGWLVFAEPLMPATVAGAALIIGACLFAARRRPIPYAASEGAA